MVACDKERKSKLYTTLKHTVYVNVTMATYMSHYYGMEYSFKLSMPHYVRPPFTVSRLSWRNLIWSGHLLKKFIRVLNGFPSWRGYNDRQF